MAGSTKSVGGTEGTSMEDLSLVTKANIVAVVAVYDIASRAC